MNTPRWNRLVHAARQAPPRPAPEMPLGFDTRVIAGWRAARTGPVDLLAAPFILPLLRRAALSAALVALIVVGLSFSLTPEGDGASTTDIADSALQLTMLP